MRFPVRVHEHGINVRQLAICAGILRTPDCALPNGFVEPLTGSIPILHNGGIKEELSEWLC